VRAVLTLTLSLAVVSASASGLRLAGPAAGERVIHVYRSGAVLVEDRAESRTIRIAGHEFDPPAGPPALAPGLDVADDAADGGGLYLVQFIGAIDGRWRDVLIEQGAEVLDYVPHHTYLVRLAGGRAAAVAQSAEVRAVVALAPGLKLMPEVRPLLVSDRVVRLLIGLRAAEVDAALARLGQLGVEVVRREPLLGQVLVDALISGDRVAALARDPDVVSISRWWPGQLEDEVANRIVDGTSGFGPGVSPPGYLGWLAGRGVDGDGVTVAVIDSGVDEADPSGHLNGRVTSVLRGASPGTTGHGHHVAGIIAGQCGHLDPDLYEWGIGVAPFAALLNIPRFMPGYTGSDRDQVRDAVTTPGVNGVPAAIASCSFGIGIGSDYGMIEREWDAFVRDADDLGAGNQGLFLSFSAGNAGSGRSSLSRPKAAKNVVTVGNALSYRPALGSDSFTVMNIGSSRGPASDGRIKPDLVAPGTSVASALVATPPCLPGIDGEHTYCTGTSMAQPHVAGAAALFVDAWQQDRGLVPSPALLKAALINGARDMPAGPQGPPLSTGPVPNIDEGWGLIDIGASVRSPVPSVHLDEAAPLTMVGEVARLELAPFDRLLPLKVTLVWTDAPAAVGADPALVNDLDLTVRASLGGLYRGNAFVEGWSSSAPSTADRLNNVENVFVRSPADDLYTVEVVVAAVPGDGVPGNGDPTDQDFALVVQNADVATADGQVRLLRSSVRCGGRAEILVYDTGLTGSVEVIVSSTTEPAGEALTLVEASAGSVFLRGAIDLEAGAPMVDGRLQVQSGDAIEVTYVDADDGMGGFDVIKVSAGEVDCDAPVITNVRVSAITDRSATIEWQTDEPTTSEVRLLTPTARVVSSDSQVEQHAVDIEQLEECGLVTFAVASADAAGNETVDDAGGPGHALTTFRRAPVVALDFEGDDGGFVHFGTFEVWEWGAPLDGPPAAASGDRVWGTDLDAKYVKERPSRADGNMILLSPSIDLRGLSGARLRFQHYYEIATDGDTDDGAWLEVWDGSSWHSVFPEGGYPSTVDDDAPARPSGAIGAWAGRTADWEEVEVGLDDFVGNVIRVKLHLFVEADILAGTPGWYIDDFEVFSFSSCRQGTVRIDRPAVSCAGVVPIEVRDNDLDLDPGAIDEVVVIVASATETAGEPVRLIESSPASALFVGSIDTAAGAAVADGRLQVKTGDVVSAAYDDADDGSGRATRVVDSIPVDCEAPTGGGLRFESITDRSAIVTWWTEEPSTGRVDYGPTSSVEDHTLSRAHRLTVGELSPCVEYGLVISSRDVAGGEWVDDAGGDRYGLLARTGLGIRFHDDFEVDRGWSLQGEWERGRPLGHELVTPTTLEPNAAVSGTDVLGVDLSGLGLRPGNYEAFATGDVATTPALDLSTLGQVWLEFSRWLGVERHDGGNGDNAVIEISTDGGSFWTEVWGNPDASDVNDRFWLRESIDITALAAGQADVRARFRIEADDAAEFMGWQLDDLAVRDPGQAPFQACAAALRHLGFTLDDSAGDGDGEADPGESVVLSVELANDGVAAATGVSIGARTGRPDQAAFSLATAILPDIISGGSATSLAPHLVLEVDGCATPGSRVPISLAIATASGRFGAGFEVVLGGSPADLTRVMTTGSPVTVPDDDPTGVAWSLDVAEPGILTGLVVTVDLSHPEAADLVVTLTAPDGARVTLHELSDAGAPYGRRTYPTPTAPDGPGSLADLLGRSPAGTWRLRAIDGAPGLVGQLDGWSLDLDVRRRIDTVAGPIAAPLQLVRMAGAIRATWGAAPAAAGYVLEKGAERDVGDAAPVGTTAALALVEPLALTAPGVRYYRVRPFDPCGRSGP